MKKIYVLKSSTILSCRVQTSQRGREAAVRGGGGAAAGAAQEGSPGLQVPAAAEEVGEEQPERVRGRQRDDTHFTQRNLQGPTAGRLPSLQHGRGALSR